MGECSWSYEWKTVSVRLQSRNSLGRRHDRKSRLACREGICRKARLVESRATRPPPVLCHAAGGELEQIQFLLGHVSVQTTEKYLGCKQRLKGAVNDQVGIEPAL